MSWLENFSKAIEYIETHLDKEISYEDMAKITGCSTFYFQRIFSYIVGISLSEYIRRRRMTQAGFDLQRTDMRVLDVAFKYGYSSPTSFNRAFQAVHGITPICAKEMGSTLNTYPAIKFSINVVGGNAMSYRIEKKKAFRIVGVRTSLSEDIEKNQKNVPLFWDTVSKCLFTWEYIRSLQIAVYHRTDSCILIHISDNNRNLFKTSKLCRMSPSVTGDDFIFTITQRSYQ